MVCLMSLILLDHENYMFVKEGEEIDEVFLKQEPMLKHNLPVEILGDTLAPKGDPVFELKPLPENLVLMKIKYILLLLVLTFQSKKKKYY